MKQTMDKYSIPQTYPGLEGQSWMSRIEIDALIRQLPDAGEVIEVGTASGVTAAMIASSRPGITMVCLDVFCDPSEDHPYNGADRVLNRRDHWIANRKPNMFLFEMTLSRFCDEKHFVTKCDHVIVDGDHSVIGVKRDLECLARSFRPQFIYAHDYGDSYWTGVKTSVDEFCVKHGYFISEKNQSLVTLKAL